MVVVPFSSSDFGRSPDTYQPAGLERGTATSKSTTTGTTSFGGLGFHTWIDGEDDLDPELRDMTLGSACIESFWGHALERSRKSVEQFVDEQLGRFVAATRLDTATARARLETVIAAGVHTTDAERDVIWDIWKTIN